MIHIAVVTHALFVGKYYNSFHYTTVTRCDTCTIYSYGVWILGYGSCTNCGYPRLTGDYNNYSHKGHKVCSICSGYGAAIIRPVCTNGSDGKQNCNICGGRGTTNCTTCSGQGYKSIPYSCGHGRSGGNNHYYCTSSSKHGNIVNQYHK